MATANEAMEQAARARAKSRQAFIVALRCRKELLQVASRSLGALESLCLVDSLEWGLRAFALFEAGRAPHRHDLKAAFGALSSALQLQLITETGEPVERLDSNLGLIQDARRAARHDLRSVDARGSSLQPSDLRLLRRFARAVQRQLHGHASAAPKSVAGPAPEASEEDPTSGKPPASLSCSFCRKDQHEVRKLIAGPDVYICDECISLCNDIIVEEIAGEPRRIDASSARANAVVALARHFAQACAEAVEFPRPAAERARALAEEIEVVIEAHADARVVLGEYAQSVAVMARHFAKACDAVELPGAVAERARSLLVEIESLMAPSGQT